MTSSQLTHKISLLEEKIRLVMDYCVKLEGKLRDKTQQSKLLSEQIEELTKKIKEMELKRVVPNNFQMKIKQSSFLSGNQPSFRSIRMGKPSQAGLKFIKEGNKLGLNDAQDDRANLFEEIPLALRKQLPHYTHLKSKAQSGTIANELTREFVQKSIRKQKEGDKDKDMAALRSIWEERDKEISRLDELFESLNKRISFEV